MFSINCRVVDCWGPFPDRIFFSSVCSIKMRLSVDASFLDVQFGRDWFLSTEASSLRTSILEQLHRLFDQEILDQKQSAVAEVNKEGVSNGGTAGGCEVVIRLDGEGACESSVTLYACRHNCSSF